MIVTQRNTTGAQEVPLPRPNATPWLWTRIQWSQSGMIIHGMSYELKSPGGGSEK
jgi:hypothetical protein